MDSTVHTSSKHIHALRLQFFLKQSFKNGSKKADLPHIKGNLVEGQQLGMEFLSSGKETRAPLHFGENAGKRPTFHCCLPVPHSAPCHASPTLIILQILSSSIFFRRKFLSVFPRVHAGGTDKIHVITARMIDHHYMAIAKWNSTHCVIHIAILNFLQKISTHDGYSCFVSRKTFFINSSSLIIPSSKRKEEGCPPYWHLDW